MTFSARFFILICSFLASTSWAENAGIPSFEEAFRTGAASYQAEKFSDAVDAFQKAVELNPEQPQALINLSLAQYKAGNKIRAYALMRRAQSLAPQLTLPKSGLEFYLSELKIPDVPREISSWNDFRKSALQPYSLNAFLSFLALSLLAFGLSLIKFIAKRQSAIKTNSLLPSFGVTQVIFCILFPAFLALTALKYFDLQILRAVVAVEKLSVQSAPDEGSPSLLELFGGLEVEVSAERGEWAQITYPGTSTGWTLKSNLIFLANK